MVLELGLGFVLPVEFRFGLAAMQCLCTGIGQFFEFDLYWTS